MVEGQRRVAKTSTSRRRVVGLQSEIRNGWHLLHVLGRLLQPSLRDSLLGGRPLQEDHPAALAGFTSVRFPSARGGSTYESTNETNNTSPFNESLHEVARGCGESLQRVNQRVRGQSGGTVRPNESNNETEAERVNQHENQRGTRRQRGRSGGTVRLGFRQQQQLARRRQQLPRLQDAAAHGRDSSTKYARVHAAHEEHDSRSDSRRSGDALHGQRREPLLAPQARADAPDPHDPRRLGGTGASRRRKRKSRKWRRPS
mmetsp:Transcript_30011/g.99414  ORF Transcript_30011/g.99414 Transcript_30011/m.99414 type:complete len:258 (-) Transcript_30011:212-985(-)